MEPTPWLGSNHKGRPQGVIGTCFSPGRGQTPPLVLGTPRPTLHARPPLKSCWAFAGPFCWRLSSDTVASASADLSAALPRTGFEKLVPGEGSPGRNVLGGAAFRTPPTPISSTGGAEGGKPPSIPRSIPQLRAPREEAQSALAAPEAHPTAPLS
ncbi:hypothetical protein QTO34_002416 [Cnephaeus nilssonii]|nr:hypothetical protein QTO34_002416 [Eptesicus nilssonii]